MAQSSKNNLVEIIQANPGCIAVIDNDCWDLVKTQDEPEGFDDWDLEKQDRWYESQRLASSDDDLVELGDGGYGSGHRYGGDVLQALAAIVGISVRSV